MGLIGGVFGLLAGLGCVVIFIVAYGGHTWGISFPLWPTALEVAGVALPGAILGLIAAPADRGRGGLVPGAPRPAPGHAGHAHAGASGVGA